MFTLSYFLEKSICFVFQTNKRMLARKFKNYQGTDSTSTVAHLLVLQPRACV